MFNVNKNQAKNSFKNSLYNINSIDNIISSNKKNSDHIITLCYQNTCTEDENEMRTIKKNFTEKIPTSDPNWFEKTTQYYDIILDYDEAGYVNKITIE